MAVVRSIPAPSTARQGSLELSMSHWRVRSFTSAHASERLRGARKPEDERADREPASPPRPR